MSECPKCGSALSIGDWPFCGPSGHGRAGNYAEHGDEVDFWVENMGPEPIHIRSKAEHRRLMKERGLTQFVRHVPHPAGTRKNHTVDWSLSADDYTMAYKKELLERAFRNPVETTPDRPVMIPEVRALRPDEVKTYVDRASRD